MLTVNCFCVLPTNMLRCSACLIKNVISMHNTKVRLKHHDALKLSYQTLGLSENCEDEDLRLAFVYLAKQYHPDSGCTNASTAKFSEIESAYRAIQRDRIAKRDKDHQSLPNVEEFDIKHTAPQHRHFLAYDTGVGTPSERQQRHTAVRAQKAVDNVMEHRLKKIQAAERNTLVGMDKRRAKDIKTQYGIDRLVEDLIQEAMNKGEFSNLSGSGKPLKDRSSAQNPYVDFVTHKINEILIDNGFTPEWIQLSKEVREEIDDLNKYLKNVRDDLGTVPLSIVDDKKWKKALDDAQTAVKEMNSKINKYNLLVPILQKQMLLVNLNNLAEKALAHPPSNITRKKVVSTSSVSSSNYNDESLLDIIFSSFEWKKDNNKT